MANTRTDLEAFRLDLDSHCMTAPSSERLHRGQSAEWRGAVELQSRRIYLFLEEGRYVSTSGDDSGVHVYRVR